MQLQLLARGRQREHLVVQLLERRALAQQCEPPADARDVGVDGNVVQAVGEQQHARGRLAPDARQRDEVVARLLERDPRQPVERELVWRIARVVGDRAQDRLDAGRLHLRDAAGADRLLDLLERRVAHLLPARHPCAQAQVGDVAVAVVGRLREHRQDQLGDRVAVRSHQRARRRSRAGVRGCEGHAPCVGARPGTASGPPPSRRPPYCLPAPRDGVFLPRARGQRAAGRDRDPLRGRRADAAVLAQRRR